MELSRHQIYRLAYPEREAARQARRRAHPDYNAKARARYQKTKQLEAQREQREIAIARGELHDGSDI